MPVAFGRSTAAAAPPLAPRPRRGRVGQAAGPGQATRMPPPPRRAELMSALQYDYAASPASPFALQSAASAFLSPAWSGDGRRAPAAFASSLAACTAVQSQLAATTGSVSMHLSGAQTAAMAARADATVAKAEAVVAQKAREAAERTNEELRQRVRQLEIAARLPSLDPDTPPSALPRDVYTLVEQVERVEHRHDPVWSGLHSGQPLYAHNPPPLAPRGGPSRLRVVSSHGSLRSAKAALRARLAAGSYPVGSEALYWRLWRGDGWGEARGEAEEEAAMVATGRPALTEEDIGAMKVSELRGALEALGVDTSDVPAIGSAIGSTERAKDRLKERAAAKERRAVLCARLRDASAPAAVRRRRLAALFATDLGRLLAGEEDAEEKFHLEPESALADGRIDARDLGPNDGGEHGRPIEPDDGGPPFSWSERWGARAAWASDDDARGGAPPAYPERRGLVTTRWEEAGGVGCRELSISHSVLGGL